MSRLLRGYLVAGLVLVACSVSARYEGPKPQARPRHLTLGLPWTLEGSFHPNGPGSGLKWSGTHAVEEADSASNEKQTGSLRSSPFSAPALLQFYQAGEPSAPGMRVYLQDERSGYQLSLLDRTNPGPQWRMRIWKLPRSWRGRSVRLIAVDGSSVRDGWMGMTAPQQGVLPIGSSIWGATTVMLRLLLYALIFLLPGIVALLIAGRRLPLDFARAVALVTGGSALAAYALFWAYLWKEIAGLAASWTMVAACLGAIPMLVQRVGLPRDLCRQLLLCGVTMFAASALSCSLGFLSLVDDDPGEAAAIRYLPGALPPDNILPQLFAYKILGGGKTLQEPMIEYWHTSDRPPLQTAVTLFEFPFSSLPAQPMQYQLTGVFLQSVWIAGLASLLMGARVSAGRTAGVIAFAGLSSFVLIHSFYVWPKLLAAGLCCTGLALLPSRGADRWNLPNAVLAGMMFGAALLSHPGMAFTAVPALFLFCWARGLPPWRVMVGGIVPLSLFQLPWSAYQKWVDPPGDNLLKLHLAGYVDPARSLWQCVRAGYGGISFFQIVQNKWANFATVFGISATQNLPVHNGRELLIHALGWEFFYVSLALGFAAAGPFVRLIRRRQGDRAVIRAADRFAAISAMSLFLWCLTLFGPGTTVIHAGSLATVLLLFAAFVLYLEATAPRLSRWLVAAQALLIFPFACFGPYFLTDSETVADTPLNPGMVLWAVLSGVALAMMYVRVRRGEQMAKQLLVDVHGCIRRTQAE